MHLAIWSGNSGETIILGIFDNYAAAKLALENYYNTIKRHKNNTLGWNQHGHAFEIINGKPFGISICSVRELTPNTPTWLYI